MRRLLNRLYYLTETLLVQSPAYQLMLVAMVILGLSLFGGLVVHFTNPGMYSDTLAAIWWAFLRLTDPGYLGDDRGVMPRVVSTFLTVAGYVVFLGALVAIMTNWLDRLMGFLASGRSPIFEEGHVLIIGWNERIHVLIEELVHTIHQAGRGDKRPAIAILSEPYEPAMYRRLLQRLDPKVRKSCRLLIRSGNPLEAESLDRVDFAHARSIILIAHPGSERSTRHLSDITLAKVLMSMRALAPELSVPPNVVVEVSNPANKALAESVGWADSTEAVVGDEIMGRLFFQSVRFPGISKVYQRLLTDTFGNSIVLVPAAELGAVGKSLRQVSSLLREGTPIGFLSSAGRQKDLQLLNLDQPLQDGDAVVLVVSPEPRTLAGSADAALAWRSSARIRSSTCVLVVGWSTHLVSFLKEASAYEHETFQITLVWESKRPSERERLERLCDGVSNVTLTFLQGTLLDQVETANLGSFDKVVLLSDAAQEPLVADAENILRYVLVDRATRGRQSELDLVVELYDEDNRPLLTGREPDVLMTAEMLSHLLAQVSVHRSLIWIYEELFSKGGAELRLRSLADFRVSEALYGCCSRGCLEAGAVAIGAVSKGRVLLNPGADLRLAGGDSLIVVEMESTNTARV